MSTDDTERKDCIARRLGWPSYDDAPDTVQRTIDHSPNASVVDSFADALTEALE